MRNTQTVKDFLSKWRNEKLPSKELLYDYMPVCRNLLYEDEDLVRDVLCILKSNIEIWAKKFSPIYSEDRIYISKKDLEDKSTWYVGDLMKESQGMSTSGSTTGTPFHYTRWDPFLYFIEAQNHYDLILDEFEVCQNPKILNLFNSNLYDQNKLVTIRSDSQNFMDHHGKSRNAEVHYVNFDIMKKDHVYFFTNIIEYLENNPVDVIFSPGPSVNSMCHYIRKRDKKTKICRLLSNTNERLLQEDACFLLDNHLDFICDHMRCWDGGATFFTCRHRNYHLLDNLSWCEDLDGKLISTDYFSITSPFIKYWNGDFCSIKDNFSRCECGRLYREFEFLENRPFSLKGACLKDLKSKIEKINSKCIKQIRCGLNTIDIISSEAIPDHQKEEILKITDKFGFQFIIED